MRGRGRRGRIRGPRGFTLIEVLLALGITAIILSALYSSLLVTQRAVQASQETLVALHEARAALDVMRREVEAAFTMDGTGGKEMFIVKDRDFYGAQASGMSFVTHASVLHGPARVSYRVVDIDGRLTLIKTLTTIGRSEDDAPEAEMVEEIASFSVEALEQGSRWVRTWNRKEMPPKVRISLEVPLAGRTVMLTVTAMPRKGRKI